MLGSSVLNLDSLLGELGSSLEVLGALWASPGPAFLLVVPGVLSPVLVNWLAAVSLARRLSSAPSLGLSDFLGGSLGPFCEEPASPREVLDSLWVLAQVPLDVQGGGALVGQGVPVWSVAGSR